MKEQIRQEDVKHVIEELDTAYHTFSDYNHVNTDYPGFARMAVGKFRHALHDPELTREDLEVLLRKGIKKYRAHSSEVTWTSFVASYMAQSSNANDSSKEV